MASSGKGDLYDVLLQGANDLADLASKAQARTARFRGVLARLADGSTTGPDAVLEVVRLGVLAAVVDGGLDDAVRQARDGLLAEMRAYEKQDPATVPALKDLDAARDAAGEQPLTDGETP